MTTRFIAFVRNPSLWWSLVAVWFSLLFVLSSISHLPPGPQILNFDKFEHTAYYSLGAACFYLARRFKNRTLTGLATAIATVLFCMAVGAFDEFHQSFVPNRSGNDPYDWMADTLGGFLGSLFGWIAFCFLSRRSPGER